MEAINEGGATYRLDGKALEIAKELHDYTKSIGAEALEIERQCEEFNDALMGAFDEKHNQRFQDIFQRLADELSIPVNLMRQFNLDATYLEDHNIAFMKQGPIQDKVFGIQNDEPDPDQLEIFEGEL
jgi:hypothetical protein